MKKAEKQVREGKKGKKYKGGKICFNKTNFHMKKYDYTNEISIMCRVYMYIVYMYCNDQFNLVHRA